MTKFLPVLMTLIAFSGTDVPVNTQQIPSTTLPPQTESTVVFTDNGITYIVGTRTGTVTKFVGGSSPEPVPTPIPDPPPVPPVVPSSEKPAWFSFVFDPSDTAAMILRADRQVRESLAGIGVTFRAYASNQSEVVSLGLKDAIGSLKMPVAISQRADGTIIDAKSVTNSKDILSIIKGWEK